jgi:zinc protease
MLFKGTGSRPVGQIANEIESAGGDINAYTTMDNTVYYVVLASRFFDTGLDVLADAVLNSSFDPLETEREKEVVLEEIKRGNDIPARKLSQEVFASSYSVHPYRRPIIGYQETVSKFTSKQLLSFYRKWYVGENITLVVVGDIEPKEALRKIDRAFKGLPAGKRVRRRNPSEPPQKRLKTLTMADELNETYLEMAFHTPGIRSDDLFPLDVLAVALGQGESSILFRTVKASEGLVHNLYSYSFTPRECGLFLISGVLDLNRSQKAVRRILEECSLLSREGLSEEDLERAKTNLESDFIYQKETVQGQARELGYLHSALNDVTFEKEYLRRVQQVSASDVRRVVRRYLKPSNLTVGMLHPEVGNGRDVRANIESAVKTAFSAPMARKTHRRAVVSPTRGEVSATTKVTLNNGIRLLVRENHTSPIVAFRCVLKGGVRYEDEGNNGINNFIAEMLTKGTKKRTAMQIAQETEAIAGHLDGFAGRNSIGVYGEFLSRYFDKGLDLVSDVLQNPSFRKGELEKKRRDIFSTLRQQQDNPSQLAFLEFARTLYRKHPYRLNIQGSFESVAALDKAALERYYHRIIAPETLVVSVVGDIETEEVVEKVRRCFGTLKPSRVQFPRVPSEPRLRKPRIREIHLEKEQAHIVLGFLGARMTEGGRYPLMVLNAVLSGQGGRLFLELRDKMSLAYSVTSFSQEGIDPGCFGIYMGTSPEKVDSAIESIKRELHKVLDCKVTGVELERAKKFVIGTYEIELQRCSAQAARLAFYESYGVGHRELQRYPEKIMKVTAQEVLEAARRYLDMERYALAVIRPAP